MRCSQEPGKRRLKERVAGRHRSARAPPPRPLPAHAHEPPRPRESQRYQRLTAQLVSRPPGSSSGPAEGWRAGLSAPPFPTPAARRPDLPALLRARLRSLGLGALVRQGDEMLQRLSCCAVKSPKSERRAVPAGERREGDWPP